MINFSHTIIFLACLIFCTCIRGQIVRHVPGELIIMVKPGEHPVKIWAKPLRSVSGHTHLTLKKILSRRMNIFLVSLDTLELSESVAIDQLHNWPEIIYAQKNHYISQRVNMSTIPNDPMFGMQWSLENTGQVSGVPDADIDATDAWDISTGGITSLGDTIVVAVIDKGVDMSHQDLILWKNRAEIPGDGLDNDGNGYIDDFHGWNVNTESDSIPPTDPHGTQISGIIAARGNDSVGIVGVNWYTQIMPVVNFLSVESELVESYEYVLTMRARYNQSGGAEGAFVVATNSSFGIDFARPEDYPVWCAVYDSLGAEGILSIAATLNSGKNIDVIGDMPTACSSDWLITVTNTTAFDELSGGAGYGLNTIDLGAPGTQIRAPLPGNNYGIQSGTSFSAPHVTGAVALLFASACPGIINQYKLTPAAMALKFKNWIMDGVDSLPSLQGKSVSGGRLNVANSIFDQLGDCASYNPDCPSPFDLKVSQLEDTSALLSWAQIDSAVNYILRYRKLPDSSWSIVQLDSNRFHLGGLMACTSYVFQVSALCDNDNSGFLASLSFTTEACCEAPTEAQLTQFSDSLAHFEWQPVFGANKYLFLYKSAIASVWDTLVTTDTHIYLPLLPCTEYFWQVATICDSVLPQATEPKNFISLGCGFCRDQSYCISRGENVQFEWIDSVGFGPIQNLSGPNGGYGRVFDSVFTFRGDSAYDISLVPGYQTFNSAEYWRIWIDLDQDGEFNDSTELILDISQGLVGPLYTSINFPTGSVEGSTRMRISMKFEGVTGNDSRPDACERFEFGEVEDYCIWIDRTVGLGAELKDPSVWVSPNPFGDMIRIKSENELENVKIFNIWGQLVQETPVRGQETVIFTQMLTSGVYLLRVNSHKGLFQQKILKR